MTDTDNLRKQLLKGASSVFVAGMIGYVLMFFFRIILAREYAPAEVGLYEMLTTILSISTVIGGLGLYAGINRYIPHYESKQEWGKLRGLQTLIFYVQLLTSTLVAATIFFAAPLLTQLFSFPDIFTYMLRVASLAIPFMVFTKSSTQYLFAQKHAFLAKLGSQGLHHAILLVGVVVMRALELPILTIAYLLLGAKLLEVTYYAVTKRIKLQKTPGTQKTFETKKWFLFSIPLAVSGLLAFFLNWTDNFVIATFLSDTDLGVYSIAYSLANYLFFIPNLFGSIFIPVLTKKYIQDFTAFQKLFEEVKNGAFLLTAFFGAPLIIFSEQIITFLFGEAYVPGAGPLMIVSVLFLGANYFYFYQKFLVLEEKTPYIFWANAFVVVLNIILSIALARAYGILGVAVATGVSKLLVEFAMMVKARSKINSKIGVKTIGLSLVFFGIAVVTYYVTLYAVPNAKVLLKLIVSGSLYVLICAYILWKTLDVQHLLVIDRNE